MSSSLAISTNLIANGTIAPASFVKLDPSNDQYGLQAGLGDQAVVVAGPGSDALPLNGGAALNAAVATEPILGYSPNMTAPLQAGVGGWVRGWVKPDASGFGITANPGDIAGAYAYQSAAVGEQRNVRVTGPTIVPGTSGGAAGAVVTATVSTALSSTQAGAKIEVGIANAVITLPPVATSKGIDFTIYETASTATYTGATTPTVIAINAADTATVKLFGTGLSAVAGKGLQNTKATATQGDQAFVWCDGTNWYARWFGVWIAQP